MRLANKKGTIMKNRLLLATFLFAGFSVVAEEAAETTETVVQDAVVAFVYKNFKDASDDLVTRVKKAITDGTVAGLDLTEDQKEELLKIVSERTVEDTTTN
jgi:hypothetical protein